MSTVWGVQPVQVTRGVPSVLRTRTQLDDYTRRFYAQFKRPDPEAPFEKRPRPNSTKLLRKQYVKLDTFIQAIEREKIIYKQQGVL